MVIDSLNVAKLPVSVRNVPTFIENLTGVLCPPCHSADEDKMIV